MPKWHKTLNEKPPVNKKTGESEYMLCLSPNNSTPFVGWYNAKNDSWTVAHWKADSLPVPVTMWRKLPAVPKQGA